MSTTLLKPKVFIASPLFNSRQIEIIEDLEGILEENELEYYSARKHSGSEKLSLEEKRKHTAWEPVYRSNETGLDECRIMIAVIDYALPYGQSVQLCRHEESGETAEWDIPIKKLDLPDSGTIFEVGYHRAQGKLVLSFFPEKKEVSHLNIMISHGTDGTILGWDNLETFLASSVTAERGEIYLNNDGKSRTTRDMAEQARVPASVLERAHRLGLESGSWAKGLRFMADAALFDWSATVKWDGEFE